MLGRSLFRIFAAAFLLALATTARAPAKETKPTSDDLIKRWADGPVRYLMSAKEDSVVRGMKSVPELAKFISEFWARRDPTPGTLENEFRRVFWRRVLDAEHRYRDSTTPGWMTDRGKVFIMLGRPDDVQTDENPRFSAGLSKGVAATNDTTGHQRGIERWTYHRAKSIAADAEFIVAFVKDESLDWKLSTDPELIQPVFPGSSTTSATNPSFGGIEGRPAQQRAIATLGQGAASPLATQLPQQAVAELFPVIDTSLFANYDLGLELSVPSTTEEVIATVTTQEFLSAFPARARFEFFRAADGSTFVNVGAIVKAEDLYPSVLKGRSGLRLYASVTPASGIGQPRYAGNDVRPVYIDLAKGPAPGGVYDVWTGLALVPGSYHVTLAIEDSLTGRIGRTAADLDVPDLWRPGLHLSTLVLASDLSDLGSRVGVTPRASAVYRNSEKLGIYFEVYGLSGGDASRFKTTYSFFRAAPDGALPLPIGKPIVLADRKGAAQGWSFPLKKWPAGSYSMQVTVTGADNVSVSDTVAFSVIE